MRADVFLVENNHASTRSQAQRLIAAGVQWRLADTLPWNRVAKNGDDIPAGAQVQLLDAAEARFCSRGGLKLEGALAATGLKVSGLRCLDVGQGTGGFTDCLLHAGAAQIIGVDVGRGQLHERLRGDTRVVCIEGINARYLTPEALRHACDEALCEYVPPPEDNHTQPQSPYAWMHNGGVVDDDYEDSAGSDDAREHDIEAFKAERAARGQALLRQRKAGCEHVDITPTFDFVTGDVSFISLTLVLPALMPLLRPSARLLMLVKPQFELQPGQVGKGGIVRDAHLYAQVEQRLRTCCAALPLRDVRWLDSPIAGGDGNREFFIDATGA